MIPHSRPTIGPEDVDAVARVLQSAHLSQGTEVELFEGEVAAFVQRRGGVATSSGTAALHLSLLALGVGPGDEVLLPSYTCVAVLHAVRHAGAVPRLVDIADGEYAMSLRDAQLRMTARTRAIIVPHMFGMSADLRGLEQLDLPIIEDCAQALGATYRGRPAGSLGTIAICSFYATKVITTGEGGMLLSDSEVVLRRARDLRDYDGRDGLRTRFNYKMTDFQAALGRSQLNRLPAFLARRRALAARYGAALRVFPAALPAGAPGRPHSFYRYVIGVDDAQRLARLLHDRGVECKLPVPRPLHRSLRQAGFDRTDRAAATALSIPLYPSLTDDDADAVLRAVADTLAAREGERRPVSSLRS